MRKNISSGTIWEDKAGYSRAVKIGNIIEVSGTVAVDENNCVVGKEDPYRQTKYILQKIEKAIKACGGSMKDVIRTRMYVTHISSWEHYSKAHAEVFKDIKPCTTMVEIHKLISPDYLIEIEATAVIDQ